MRTGVWISMLKRPAAIFCLLKTDTHGPTVTKLENNCWKGNILYNTLSKLELTAHRNHISRYLNTALAR